MTVHVRGIILALMVDAIVGSCIKIKFTDKIIYYQTSQLFSNNYHVLIIVEPYWNDTLKMDDLKTVESACNLQI